VVDSGVDQARVVTTPDPINKAVADAMPGAVWHPVEGAGHFVAVGAADEIFAVAAKELGVS
jgi:pimeloyl-ACP methyl ester carboxylesterase